MKKYIAVVFLMILTGTSYLAKTAYSALPVDHLRIVSQDGKKHNFEVEIAATEPDREVGLMFREHMAPDHGMLFEMDAPAIVNFWMKNTLIPLDMLFIAPDGTIKSIHANAIPQDLTPISSVVPVNGIIELNGGQAKALGIAVGDKVQHAFFKTQSK